MLASFLPCRLSSLTITPPFTLDAKTHANDGNSRHHKFRIQVLLRNSHNPVHHTDHIPGHPRIVHSMARTPTRHKSPPQKRYLQRSCKSAREMQEVISPHLFAYHPLLSTSPWMSTKSGALGAKSGSRGPRVDNREEMVFSGQGQCRGNLDLEKEYDDTTHCMCSLAIVPRRRKK